MVVHININTGYEQDLFHCRAENVGTAGYRKFAAAQALKHVGKALAKLRRQAADKSLPLLEVPFWREDLKACRKAASLLMDGARNIVIFGTGGSSLGAQALAQSAYLISTCPGSHPGRPRFLFFDNLETPWMENALDGLDPATTRYLVISKSGSTPEVLFQLVHTLEKLKDAGLQEQIHKHVVILTEPGSPADNPLRALAARHRLMVIDHPPGVGGRYSVLTAVGSLPAMLFGMDPVRMRAGAASVLEPVLNGAPADDLPPAAGAAAYLALLRSRPLNAMIMMPYSSRLRLVAAWFQQLWAESLGKGGYGTQPVTAVGPVDQHSQLQLYLDGPNDKLFTILMLETASRGFRMPRAYADLPKMEYLAGRTIGDMTDCQQRATAETLAKRGRAVRIMKIPKVDEYALGALFMHFMLETILVGYAEGINPFDQPAVELSKNLTRQYLGEIAPR